jgi:hypothetical protein
MYWPAAILMLLTGRYHAVLEATLTMEPAIVDFNLLPDMGRMTVR